MESGANFKYYFLCEHPERCSSWSWSVITRLHHNNHGLATVSGDDSLHFFRCSAVYQRANTCRCKREAKKLLNDCCVYFNIVPNDFVGVNLFDFVGLENFFKINLIAYELEGSVAKLVQRSRELYFETMKLNI